MYVFYQSVIFVIHASVVVHVILITVVTALISCSVNKKQLVYKDGRPKDLPKADGTLEKTTTEATKTTATLEEQQTLRQQGSPRLQQKKSSLQQKPVPPKPPKKESVENPPAAPAVAACSKELKESPMVPKLEKPTMSVSEGVKADNERSAAPGASNYSAFSKKNDGEAGDKNKKPSPEKLDSQVKTSAERLDLTQSEVSPTQNASAKSKS